MHTNHDGSLKMSYDQELQPIEEPPNLSPARRRRARRSLIPTNDEGRAEVLEELSRKAFPSFEFFFFSLLAGFVLGTGFLFDSQPILFLGVLIVPLLAPWVGVILATVTGSMRFFLQTLIGLLIGMGLIFVSSLLIGKLSLIYPSPSFLQATMHSHLWIPNLILVILGSAMLVVAFIRSEKRPIIPSVMLAYGLFPPLSIAGFGYGSGSIEFWTNGILVFSVHLALATFIGLISLFFVKFRPRRMGGCLLTLIIGVAAILTFTWISGSYTTIQEFLNIPWSIPAPPYQESGSKVTQIQAAAENTATPSPTSTITATLTIEKTATPDITPSETPTNTMTPEPTPYIGIVLTLNGGGANVRDMPEGTVIATLLDGTQLEILPENQIVDGTNWLNIRTSDGLVGWIIQDVISTVTPTP